jgi:outer membrane lipoprotein-sorting protein
MRKTVRTKGGKTMKKVAILGLFILLLSGCIWGMSAKEIGEKMEEKYDSLEDYRGIIVTSFDSDDGKKSMEAKFSFKKPGKSRYEYLSPEEMKGNVMVSDGETMWVYDAGKNEVQKVTMPKYDMPEIDYGEIITDMMEKYNVDLQGSEEISNRDCYVLVMTPKDENVTMKQKMWVDKEYWMPMKIEMEMEFGGKTMKSTVEYRDMEFNVGIPDSEFEFEVPEGANVTEREMPMPKMFASIEEAQEEVDFTILVPEYIPEGYEFERAMVIDIKDGKSVSLSYKKGAEMLSLTESTDEGITGSLEGAEKVDINGREGEYMKMGMNKLLRWDCDGLSLSLMGELDKEELLKVAESVDCLEGIG